jgi:hypothetical protein
LRDDVGRQDPLATVRLRWTDPDSDAVDELTREIRASDLARSFEASDPYFRFDAIVAATAEVLRDSPWTQRLDLARIADTADREASGLPQTDEVHRFLDLLDAMAAMED